VQVMQTLLDKGIATRRGIMCAHREAAYEAEPWKQAGSLVESERAQEECILLPLYHQLTAAEQDQVVSELRAALDVMAIV
jgi:perosamine synthetase